MKVGENLLMVSSWSDIIACIGLSMVTWLPVSIDAMVRFGGLDGGSDEYLNLGVSEASEEDG